MSCTWFSIFFPSHVFCSLSSPSIYSYHIWSNKLIKRAENNIILWLIIIIYISCVCVCWLYMCMYISRLLEYFKNQHQCKQHVALPTEHECIYIVLQHLYVLANIDGWLLHFGCFLCARARYQTRWRRLRKYEPAEHIFLDFAFASLLMFLHVMSAIGRISMSIILCHVCHNALRKQKIADHILLLHRKAYLLIHVTNKIVISAGRRSQQSKKRSRMRFCREQPKATRGYTRFVCNERTCIVVVVAFFTVSSTFKPRNNW